MCSVENIKVAQKPDYIIGFMTDFCESYSVRKIIEKDKTLVKIKERAFAKMELFYFGWTPGQRCTTINGFMNNL